MAGRLQLCFLLLVGAHMVLCIKFPKNKETIKTKSKQIDIPSRDQVKEALEKTNKLNKGKKELYVQNYNSTVNAPILPIKKCCPKEDYYDCGENMAVYPQVFWWARGDIRYICWTPQVLRYAQSCSCSRCINVVNGCPVYGQCYLFYRSVFLSAFCIPMSGSGNAQWTMISRTVGSHCSCLPPRTQSESDQPVEEH